MKRVWLSFVIGLFSMLLNAQSVQFNFTTVSFQGSENGFYLAVWVMNSSNVFQKSLLTFIGGHPEDMPKWVSETGSSKVGAITGATKPLSQHIARTLTWDCKDKNGNMIPDGTYNIRLEGTSNQNGNTNVYTFSFEKGSNAATLTPAGDAHVKNISIVFTPAGTPVTTTEAVQNVLKINSANLNGLNVDMNLIRPSEIVFKLYDILGNQVKAWHESGVSGLNRHLMLRFNETVVARGNYILVAETDQYKLDKKLVIN